jgi:hypothetical protein
VEIVTDQFIFVGEIDREVEDIPLHEGQALGYFGADALDTLPIAFGFADVFRAFLAEYER